MIVSRALAPIVRDALATTPIVIVEGMRAVGKTHLVKALLSDGTLRYRATLTDPTTRDAARNQPLAWLRTLPQPFAVDEAQLAPELPLALKAFLDETGETFRCLLTGSASIGQQGFGGADPLARRALRLTLEPLSESELRDEPFDLVSSLFDGVPRQESQVASDPWKQTIPRGGLPRHRLHAVSRMSAQVNADLDAILTRDVLPDTTFDRHIARRVVDHVLRHPAQELKVAAIASALEIDARTVGRYLDIAEDRFLIAELPNLVRSAKRTARTGAKAYPADTALSSALLGSSVAALSDVSRGGLFEAHVVQQLRAHLGWSSTAASLSHWRAHPSGHTVEVDIVLEDNAGRLVGVEVKSGSIPRRSDFAGLRALRDTFPDRFHRGYVVSAAETVAPAGDDLWRIPVMALHFPRIWASSSTTPPPSAGSTPEREPAAMNEARLFMSYSHADQASATGGDLRKFADDVVDAMEGLFGRSVSIFRDTRDGQWGEDLWGRLDAELEASTFLLPFITPRYLKSEGCRREFQAFDERASARGSAQRILPLVWIAPPGLDSNETADPIVMRLRHYRREDATAARTSTGATYGQIVEDVAGRLEALIVAREKEVDSEVHSPVPDDTAESTFDELVDRIAEQWPRMTDLGTRFSQDFERLTQALNVTLDLENSRPGDMKRSMLRAAQGTKQPAAALTAAAQELTASWATAMDDLTALARLSRQFDQEVPSDLVADVAEMANALDADWLTDADTTIVAMTRLSSAFGPAARALREALTTARTIQQSAERFVAEHNQGH